MAELYPAFPAPGGAERAGKTTAAPESAYFDFETGDFALGKGGGMLRASPYDAWIQWCLKTLHTPRRAFFSYGGGFGAELEEALREPTRDAKENAIERAVTEALLADPHQRTKYVRDFAFTWKADAATVFFTVGGIWEKDAALSVKIQ